MAALLAHVSGRGPSKADPIFRGSKPVVLPTATAETSSKADPIFRGSKPHTSSRFSLVAALPKQTRSSGGQNNRARSILHTSLCFQSRPDLQGVKTFAGNGITNSLSFPSKADPIFRGSK